MRTGANDMGLCAEVTPWADGRNAGPPERVEILESPLPRHVRGLSFTASGYGARIPSPYLIRWKGRLRRVYVAQWGNAGTAYIGRPGAWEGTVDTWTEGAG
jgi:hypothetical protein